MAVEPTGIPTKSAPPFVGLEKLIQGRRCECGAAVGAGGMTLVAVGVVEGGKVVTVVVEGGGAVVVVEGDEEEEEEEEEDADEWAVVVAVVAGRGRAGGSGSDGTVCILVACVGG